jgi:hypothetical protein
MTAIGLKCLQYTRLITARFLNHSRGCTREIARDELAVTNFDNKIKGPGPYLMKCGRSCDWDTVGAASPSESQLTFLSVTQIWSQLHSNIGAQQSQMI